MSTEELPAIISRNMLPRLYSHVVSTGCLRRVPVVVWADWPTLLRPLLHPVLQNAARIDISRLHQSGRRGAISLAKRLWKALRAIAAHGCVLAFIELALLVPSSRIPRIQRSFQALPFANERIRHSCGFFRDATIASFLLVLFPLSVSLPSRRYRVQESFRQAAGPTPASGPHMQAESSACNPTDFPLPGSLVPPQGFYTLILADFSLAALNAESGFSAL